MESVKRGRGRPMGSGENDTGPLMAVARMLVDDPKLKPTTAMKRVRQTRRDWNAGSDDALIRRWQVKWKAEGAAYLQRVQAERAEAERRRRERAVVQARRDPSSPAWGVVAYGSAARHAADWALDSVALGSAMQRAAAWETIVRPSKEVLAAVSAMPRMGFSATDLVTNPALAGVNASDTVRAALSAANASSIGDVITIGLALEAACVARIPKLPDGF